MATNLSKVITYAEAIQFYNELLFPSIKKWELAEKNGVPQFFGVGSRRNVWYAYIRELHDTEQISDWQYDTWSNPHEHIVYAEYKWSRPITFKREEHFPDAKDWVYFRNIEAKERGITGSHRELVDARKAEGLPAINPDWHR
jgi:hypothetical protein